MKRMINTETIEGRVFQHDLKIKTVQNSQSPNFGKAFIQGNLEIATDEAGLNVVKVHYTYVSELTKQGGKNSTFTNLKSIIEEGKTWIADGKDNATLVQVTPSIALNDFFINDNGEDQLVSEKRNEGGFVNFITLNQLNEDETARTKFNTDMLITNIAHIEANPDRNIEKDYVVVRGAIFNFRGDILPMEFSVRTEDGMKYFESLDVTEAQPLFTQVWGHVRNFTQEYTYTQASAFGENAVRTSKRTTKEYLITGASPVPYDFGDEKILTAEDVTKANQNRQVYLANVKKQRDEYMAQKAANNTPSPATPVGAVAAGNFSF